MASTYQAYHKNVQIRNYIPSRLPDKRSTPEASRTANWLEYRQSRSINRRLWQWSQPTPAEDAEPAAVVHSSQKLCPAHGVHRTWIITAQACLWTLRSRVSASGRPTQVASALNQVMTRQMLMVDVCHDQLLSGQHREENALSTRYRARNKALRPGQLFSSAWRGYLVPTRLALSSIAIVAALKVRSLVVYIFGRMIPASFTAFIFAATKLEWLADSASILRFAAQH